MTISAAFTIEGASNPAAHAVAYGTTVDLAIVSSAGLDSVEFSIIGASKSGTTFPTLTEAGSPLGSTASFAMPSDPGDGLGRSFLIKCVARSQYETAVSYGVVGAVNTDGILPVAVGEELTRDTTYGWIDVLNAAAAPSATASALPVASIETSGFSVIGKTDTGTGPAEAITMLTQGILVRRSGDVLPIQISEGNILGRLSGGDVDDNPPNAYSFTNSEANGGNPTLKVAPEDTAQVSSLATATNNDYDFAIGTDGVYRGSVTVTLKRATTGDYRTVDLAVHFTRASSTVTLVGSAVTSSTGTGTGITVAISDSTSNLRVNVANATGETVNGYVHAGWVRSDLIS